MSEIENDLIIDDAPVYYDAWEADAEASVYTITKRKLLGKNLGIMVALSEADPINFSRAWVLAQYQAFNTGITFQQAKQQFDQHRVQTSRKENPQIQPSATTKQVLSYWHRWKQTLFLQQVDYLQSIYGFDFFEHALLCHPDHLIRNTSFSSNFTLPLAGSTIRFHADEWIGVHTAIQRPKVSTDLVITLPHKLARAFNRNLPPESMFDRIIDLADELNNIEF